MEKNDPTGAPQSDPALDPLPAKKINYSNPIVSETHRLVIADRNRDRQARREKLEKKYFMEFCFAVAVHQGVPPVTAYINAGFRSRILHKAVPAMLHDPRVKQTIQMLREHTAVLSKVSAPMLVSKMWEIVRRCTDNPGEKNFQYAIAAGSVIERVLVANTKQRHVFELSGLPNFAQMTTDQLVAFTRGLDKKVQDMKTNAAITTPSRIIESTPN